MQNTASARKLLFDQSLWSQIEDAVPPQPTLDITINGVCVLAWFFVLAETGHDKSVHRICQVNQTVWPKDDYQETKS